MSERLNNRNKVIRAAALTALAMGLTACSGEKKSDAYVFSVDCGDEPLDVERAMNGYRSSSVVIECGDSDNPQAPESVELLVGDGITIDDDGEVSHQLLTIDYDYVEGGISARSPHIDSAIIHGTNAVITIDDAEITGVRVGSQSGSGVSND